METSMWIHKLIASMKHARSRTPVRPAHARPTVETLGDRIVPTVMFSVENATLLEGNTGSQQAAVTVTVSAPHANGITVNYRTIDGTATAGSDYNAVSGKLTFAKNEMSKTILVPVRGDRVVEPDEYFSIQLSNPSKGTSIANGTGYVTIVDDEPRISISDASASEGNTGTTAFAFTVSLSTAYDVPVTVNYVTSDGTASAGTDYTAASGTLTFTPGQTSQTITVAVNGNRLAGPDKSFFVNVSTPNSYAAMSKAAGVGTIIDDEPRISIADVYNYGETSFTFTVSLSAAYDQAVTVNFATADGTMIAGVDYVAASGTLTFAPGVTTQTIKIDVRNPTSTDTYFEVHLNNASSNALITNPVAYGYSNFTFYSYDEYGGYGSYYGGFYASW
jgi:chitinase